MTDGELAGAFAIEGSKEAFDELVSRHARMVFQTCRRVIGDHHDAEDATQAVFAILANRAALLTSYRSLAGWLYSTAWNVSRRAKCAKATRARYERHARGPTLAQGGEGLSQEELAELFRAVRMLPPDCLHAIVLHHLEGMTVAQIADLMGASIGTTASRLSRSRAMIRERLARRGIMVPTVSLVAILAAEQSAEAELHVVMSPYPQGAPIGCNALGPLSLIPQAAVPTAVGAAGLPLKWALAACVVLSVGAGSAATPHLFSNPTETKKTSVMASSSMTAQHTSSGKDSRDDYKHHPLEDYSTPGRVGTIVPEPSVVSVFPIAALGIRRRPRR
jgi:RNA polymerase sigma factor (sigma-70 family)